MNPNWFEGGITLFSALVVFVLCVVLVFDHDYEDGMIGRFSLILMGVAGLARTLDLFSFYFGGKDTPLSPIASVLWCGLAIFLSRHYHRFKHWKKEGRHDWRDPDKTLTGGKMG